MPERPYYGRGGQRHCLVRRVPGMDVYCNGFAHAVIHAPRHDLELDLINLPCDCDPSKLALAQQAALDRLEINQGDSR